MRRIPVRHVGIPLAEVVQVLGVEESARPTKFLAVSSACAMTLIAMSGTRYATCNGVIAAICSPARSSARSSS